MDRSKTAERRRASFIAQYLIHRNATKAAIEAGYSKRTASQAASRLLRDVKIAAAVDQGQAQQLKDANLTAVGTLEVLRRQVYADIRCLFDDQGNLKPIHALTAEEASMVAGVEVIIKNAEAGDGHTDKVHKIKVNDRARYVEMAMKHFALMTDVVRVEDANAMIADLHEGRKLAAERSRRRA